MDKIAYIQERTTRLFTHPTFYYPKRHPEITAPMPNQEEYDAKKADVAAQRNGSVSLLRPCYEEPLLTREQEWHLFRLFNFYKFQSLKSTHAQRTEAAWKYIQLSDEVRNQLLLCNTRLAANFAKKTTSYNIEEVFTDCCDFIMQAIDYFDYTRTNASGGTNKFSTYVTWVIQRQLYRSRQQEMTWQGRHVQGVYLDGFNGRDLGYAQEVAYDRQQQFVQQVLELPSEREATMLRQRFGIGTTDKSMTYQEIGDSHGVSKERVRQLINRGLEAIQEQLRTTA